MKTLLKTSFVFLVALGLSSVTFAQGTSDNQAVSATANVVAALDVALEANLDFGDILTTDTPTIAADAAEAGGVSVSGATSGQVLNVSIVFPSVLTDGTPANDLTFDTYTAANIASATSFDPTTHSAFGTLATNTITGTYTAGANNGYISVGGTISDASNGIAGNTYANNITITVDYN